MPLEYNKVAVAYWPITCAIGQDLERQVKLRFEQKVMLKYDQVMIVRRVIILIFRLIQVLALVHNVF